jgi:hypothetical protein
MKEDKYLCDLTQRNLLSGVFINGEMHPRMEKGPLYFQRQVRSLVTEHAEREKREGGEYWPARQRLVDAKMDVRTGLTGEDIEFCKGLACAPERQEGLAW